MSDMNTWVEFAKHQKMLAVESTDTGDIPPTILVERGGRIEAIVVAPQIDKRYGLQAAGLCRHGFEPDALVMVVDAHMRVSKATPGKSLDEMQEEHFRKYPRGMQAACDEENACETGDITDCLVCHRITSDGKISLVTLPYAYHGKGGPPLRWAPLPPESGVDGTEGDGKSATDPDGLTIQGFIPDSLRAIMASPPITEADFYKKLSGQYESFSPERKRFHVARAVMSILTSQGFLVADFLSGTHPEWSGAKTNAQELLDHLVGKGYLPQECKERFGAIITEHMGEVTFREQAIRLFSENPYWLPAEARESIEEFVRDFESASVRPPAGRRPSPDLGKRVRVWNGDRSRYLGEGVYEGDVTVYFVKNPDGSISSGADAERPPTGVAEGSEVVEMDDNPKIVLDNGEVVYGCQVWWEAAEEDAGKCEPNTI